jgi:predicted nucleotidyltransferase
MVNEITEILKLLISNKEETFSIRKISKIRKINYKSAYLSLKSLEEKGLVTLKRIGNTISCTFNDRFNDLVFKAEYQRREEMLKNKNFLILYNQLKKINKQFILLLFGSQVKKTVNKHSDIDLLLISSEEVAKIIHTETKLLPLDFHLTTISYEEFASMLKNKEFTVVSEAIKKNIILYGIEDYYRIVENVK